MQLMLRIILVKLFKKKFRQKNKKINLLEKKTF